VTGLLAIRQGERTRKSLEAAQNMD